MYKGYKILALAPAYNEERKIGNVVRRCPAGVVDQILVVDDGSTDDTAREARRAGAQVLSLGEVKGVGYAIREGFRRAHVGGFEIVVVMAGNDKDSPEEIPRLLDPICDEGCDFVMGSRYLPGGRFGGEMPLYRKLATRLHPLLVGAFTGKWITESTNGFRAMRVGVLQDSRIRLDQPWLDQYDLEVYLLMKLLQLGYRTKEVPCTKLYPPRRLGNTKMTPILGWWSILRPIFYLGMGLKR